MGTSKAYKFLTDYEEDHPHACGDKQKIIDGVLQGLGSSPRVWGQVPPAFIDLSGKRIIPTRVGTRFLYTPHFFCDEDHPHACGDKMEGAATTVMETGSSPRVWGQVRMLAFVVALARIIPTRVGTRCRRASVIADQ